MIAPFLRELEQVFGWLLAASWQASVLALFVLLIQRVLGSRLNPRWRYALWLLVLVRLVLPALPESALSLFQFAPTPPAALTVSVIEPLFVSAPSLPLPSVHTEIVEPGHPLSFFSLLALIWLAGAVALLILTWQVNRRFARQVANSPAITDPELLRLFAEAKAELGIRRAIRLIENGQVQSPAIMGLFQSTLLLPVDVRAKFDATELRLIFLHELAHLKRGDVIVQALIALLQILHWFNPVLWFAFRRMRIDREPATDALVLSRTGEEEKERYGLMLIKLLEHFNQRHSLPTLVGILEDKDQFKRRFSLIARFTRGAYGWSLLGVLIIGVLAVACLTKSKADAKSENNKNAQAKNVRVQLLAIDMAESYYQAHRPTIDDAVLNRSYRALEHFPTARVVTELATPPTTYGHGTGAFSGPNNPDLIIECTPTLTQGKISLAGSVTMVTMNSTWWSSDYKSVDVKPIPGAKFQLTGVLVPTQLQAIPPEGILEPQAALRPTDKEPRRLFLFVSVWPEADSIDKDAAPNADAGANTTDTSVGKDPAVAKVLVKGATQSDTAEVERLPKLEANLNVPGASFGVGSDTDLMSPLAAAVNSGQVSDAEVHPIIAKFLWSGGNRICSPLLYAISREASIEDIAKLLSQGSPADPPQDETLTPLGAAAMAGNMDSVKLLIAHGADVNKGGVPNPKAPFYRMTPLIMAAFEGQDEIVEYLLQHGATHDPAAIWTAAYNSYPYPSQRSKDHFEKTVRILIDAGALKTATPEMMGLLLVSALGTRQGPPNPMVLKMLLDAGVSPESPMPHPGENGGKPNSVIGYYRELYQKNKDAPVYAATVKPLLDMLEAADKDATPKADASVSPPPAATTMMSEAEAKQKGIAALVNGKPIFWSDINYYRPSPEADLKAKYSGDEFKQKLADAMEGRAEGDIERELAIQSFDASKDPFVASRVQERLDFAVKGFGGDKNAFVENLKKNGSSLEQFTERLRGDEIWSHMFEQRVFLPTRAYMESLHLAASADPQVKKQRQAIFTAQATRLFNEWMQELRSKAVVQRFDDPEGLLVKPASTDGNNSTRTPVSATKADVGADVAEAKEGDAALPYVIDLKPFYCEVFRDPADSHFAGYSGRKIIDGLPFDVDGESLLYGKSAAERNADYPNNISGIKIGRKFDELHLIHAMKWREYYGCPVATLRLHYADGTDYDFQMRCNFQVSDWNRLLTENEEIVADPDTKIIWRGAAPAKGTGRLFKTVLHNPFPDKKVESMEIISTRSSASYALVAATVAQSDPHREITAPMPLEPSRQFDGRMNVHVVDKDTGAPVAGAEVYTAWIVQDISLVGDSVLTGTGGIAMVKYPKSETKDLRIEIGKDGYLTCDDNWLKGWDGGSVPADIVVQLKPGRDPSLDVKAVGTDATPKADAADETYFYKALEWDRKVGAAPSIVNSTLEADARMLLAIQAGDVAALKKVLEHAVDPNTFDPDTFRGCPVYWAVHFNRPEILRLLLEHFAEGNIGPANETPLELAQRAHPDLVPILQEGIKRNRAILTAQLTAKLHSIHTDLPGFSGAPLQQKVVGYLLEATSKAGYLNRRVTIAYTDIPASTPMTFPSRSDISLWDALQTIADANKLRFDVDDSGIGCITFYPPKDKAIIHPPTGKGKAPSPAPIEGN